MPDAIFLDIMNRLDTWDVFKVTLVCKRWKNVVYDNPKDLKRFEHAKTTHLIIFTEWMDPASKYKSSIVETNDMFKGVHLARCLIIAIDSSVLGLSDGVMESVSTCKRSFLINQSRTLMRQLLFNLVQT